MKRKINTLYIDGTIPGLGNCFKEIRKFLKEEKKVNEDFNLQQDSLFSTIYGQIIKGSDSFRTIIENNSEAVNQEKHLNAKTGTAFIIIIPYKLRNGQYSDHELSWQVTELTELVGLDFNVVEAIQGESILDICQKVKNLIDSKYQF